MHQQINISNLSLSIGSKQLFENFSAQIISGQKIAIIGDNGSGKSSLLNYLTNISQICNDEITHGNDLSIGYVPQIIINYDQLSGGERFNRALSQALALYPNILLLDEPTNHLDNKNRKSLFNLLQHNYCTQIIVSHDPELLNIMDIIWHIHDNKVTIFNGNYNSYLAELVIAKQKLSTKLVELRMAKQKHHHALMKEQQRAKNSRELGQKNIEQRKWPTVTSKTKAMRAGTTASKNNAKLNFHRNEINNQLNDLWVPEQINYSFSFIAKKHNAAVLTISNGECGYLHGDFKLSNININLYGNERLAIVGDNGSGKSTLIRAILQDQDIVQSGGWITPQIANIAYFDQHYKNLPDELTLFEYIMSLSSFNSSEIRDFLNKFLFRKNEEVYNLIGNLSGGERVRLSLAIIALQQPELLILDEVTNNIDLTTRNHLVNALSEYSGALVVISHDELFLDEIDITLKYYLNH